MQTPLPHFSRIPRLFRQITPRRVKETKPKLTRFMSQFAATDAFRHGPIQGVNILFKYMYRDASNYKQHGEAIFTNHSFLALAEIEQKIRACLNEGKYFIARQVHIEERFFDALYDDDHPWHEFERVEVTTLASFDPDNWTEFKHRRDITEFIAELEKAHTAGWDEMNVRPDVKGLLQHRKDDLKQKLSGEPPC